MADKVFESLVYENAAGIKTILSSPTITQYWELRGRSGFSAPPVEVITQKYVNGNVRVVNTIKQPRTVRINMIVTGKTAAQRDKYFFEMINRLMDVSKGDVGKLYITRSDGLKVHLNCAYSSGLDVVDDYSTFHRFTLEFFAADPYFYSVENIQTVDVDEGTGLTLSETLMLNTWCLGFGNYKGTKLLTNRLNGSVDPIYEIKDPRNTLTIRNASVRTSIEFVGLEMRNDDLLVIDTRERYKRAYIRHPDGTETTAMGALRWKTISLSLPLPNGQSYLTVSTIGCESQLNVITMNQYLSA